MSDHDVLPLRVYFGVFGTLLALTGLTTWIAYQDFGNLNTTIALVIASIKVVLVVLWFMHVKQSSGLVRIFALSGFFWLMILFGYTLSDYFTRTSVRGWE